MSKKQQEKKHIAFMAPSTPGGPQYLIKDLVSHLNEHYGDQVNVQFFSSKLDYFRLHFGKFDTIISVVPFLFPPIRAKNFCLYLHGNYKKERKRSGLGNKLLYLMDYNIHFADTIIVNSAYLQVKLSLPEEKVVEIPNFITGEVSQVRTNIPDGRNLQVLTVSSTKFREKASGIIEIAESLEGHAGERPLDWHIVAGGDNKNLATLKKRIDAIDLPLTVTIHWYGWLPKPELEDLYKQSDIFVYATGLDTWGMTTMEAMQYGLPVVLLPYEVWEYVYDEQFITNDLLSRLEDITNDYKKRSHASISFVKSYKISAIARTWVSFIKNI